MISNQLNYILFILSITFAIFGLSISESDSDEDDDILTRSRRQFDVDKEVNACTDDCIMHAYPEAQGVYTLKQIRSACKHHCQEEAENIFANSKQNKEEQAEEGEEETQESSRVVLPVSSSKADCEMKCLADKQALPLLKLNKRKNLCRIKCANF